MHSKTPYTGVLWVSVRSTHTATILWKVSPDVTSVVLKLGFLLVPLKKVQRSVNTYVRKRKKSDLFPSLVHCRIRVVQLLCSSCANRSRLPRTMARWLDHIQGVRLHDLSGQPTFMLCHPNSKKPSWCSEGTSLRFPPRPLFSWLRSTLLKKVLD